MFTVVLWIGLWFGLAKQGLAMDETTFMSIICFLDIFFYVYFIKVYWRGA